MPENGFAIQREKYEKALCCIPKDELERDQVLASSNNIHCATDTLQNRWERIRLGTEVVPSFDFSGERVSVSVSIPWSVMQAEPYTKDTVRAAELAIEALEKHLSK